MDGPFIKFWVKQENNSRIKFRAVSEIFPGPLWTLSRAALDTPVHPLIPAVPPLDISHHPLDEYFAGPQTYSCRHWRRTVDELAATLHFSRHSCRSSSYLNLR